jgi:hypothetical protein
VLLVDESLIIPSWPDTDLMELRSSFSSNSDSESVVMGA